MKSKWREIQRKEKVEDRMSFVVGGFGQGAKSSTNNKRRGEEQD